MLRTLAALALLLATPAGAQTFSAVEVPEQFPSFTYTTAEDVSADGTKVTGVLGTESPGVITDVYWMSEGDEVIPDTLVRFNTSYNAYPRELAADGLRVVTVGCSGYFPFEITTSDCWDRSGPLDVSAVLFDPDFFPALRTRVVDIAASRSAMRDQLALPEPPDQFAIFGGTTSPDGTRIDGYVRGLWTGDNDTFITYDRVRWILDAEPGPDGSIGYTVEGFEPGAWEAFQDDPDQPNLFVDGFFGVAGSDDGTIEIGRADVPGDADFARWENGSVSLFSNGEGAIPFTVSADGSVAVGRGTLDSGQGRWFRTDGLAVEFMPSDGFGRRFRPFRTSADGSLIVGWSDDNNGGPETAVVWTEGGGLQPVAAYLAAAGVDPGDLAGWQLTQATGLSDDGSVIVGRGFNPDGAMRGWVARLGSSGIVVNVTSDEGNAGQSQAEGVCDANRSASGNQCTLRAAIEVANALAEDTGEPVSVGFAVDAPIQVEGALPALGAGVRLRAPAEDGEPGVRVDGGGGGYDGIRAEGAGSAVEGLSVTGFGGAGVVLSGDGATLTDAWIGLDLGGQPAGNAVGVRVEGPNAELRRAVLSGNSVFDATAPGSVAALQGVGLWLADGTADPTFDDVLVGPAPDRTAPVGNSLGLLVDGLDGFVLTLDDGLTVAGIGRPESLPPVDDGVPTLAELYGTAVAVVGADDVRLQDVRVGIVETEDDLVPMPNQRGVAVWGSDGFIMDGGVVLGISHGIWIDALPEQQPSDGARITRVSVGVAPDGSTTGGAGGTGIAVRRATGTRIGEAGGRNVVGGWGTGVHVYGTPGNAAQDTRIEGNLIGVDDIDLSLPLGVGVWVEGAAAFTRVGGWEEDGQGNTIDGGTAVAVTGDATAEPEGTRIAGNRIGIGADGVTRLEPEVGVFVGPSGVLRGDADAEGGAAGVRVGLIASEAGGAPAARRRNTIASASRANVLIQRNGEAPDDDPVFVVNNWIGLDAQGEGGLTASSVGDGTPVGVRTRGTARAFVGQGGEGNVISGNVVGVWADADETEVGWNRIGTDPDGQERRANFVGVAVTGSRVAVGEQGGAPAPNLISGNELPGGTEDDELDGVGVLVIEADFLDAFLSGAGGAVPAGSAERTSGPGAGIAGRLPLADGAALRSGRGIRQPQDNRIANNRIGTVADGSAALVPTDEINDSNGILVSLGATRTQIVRNTIGGAEAGIVLNQRVAEDLPLRFPTGTAIAGNRIGLAAGSDDPVPNRVTGIGALISLDAVIGEGAVEGEGPNLIAHSGAEGSGLPPDVFGAPGVFLLHPEESDIDVPTGRHTLRQNLIWDNQGLGITYDGESFGPGTDLEDVDEDFNPFDTPLLYQATGDAGGLGVELQTTGPGRVEVFANPACDASGYGEARVFLGAAAVPGPGIHTVAVTGAPGPTWRVSATLTNATGTTSDLARCQAISEPGGAASLAVGEGETPLLNGPDLRLEVTDNPTAAPVAATRARSEREVDGDVRDRASEPSREASALGSRRMDSRGGNDGWGEGRHPSADGAIGDATRGDAASGRLRASGTLYANLHTWTADDGPEGAAFEGSATSADGTLVTPDDVQRQRFWSARADGLAGVTYRACLRYDGLFSLPEPGQIVVVSRPHRGVAWTPSDTVLEDADGASFACAAGLTAFGELALGVDGAVNPVDAEDGPDEGPALPAELAATVYPNPSRGGATLSLALPDAVGVRAAVYDALGRRVAVVADGAMPAGVHALALPRDLAPGLYVARVEAGRTPLVTRFSVVR